jgi:hypothetical protein
MGRAQRRQNVFVLELIQEEVESDESDVIPLRGA